MRKVREQSYAVSVIVPVYNVENYLKECMNSILGQSLKEIEIICVDDGSTDNSGLILDEYSRRDSRVKVYHNLNGGYGKAMNFGLSKAVGEFVGIVEPDDYITEDMFKKLYITAKENEVVIVKSNFRRFYGEKSNRIFEDIPFSEDKKFYNRVICPKEEPDILFGTMNIWTGIYNREFIEKKSIRFNETPGASFQDNGFWFQTMTLAERVFFLDRSFYQNRRDNPNSSVKGMEKAFCVLEEFSFIENFLNSNPNIRQIFIEYFVKCKLVGYVAAYNRSSTSCKIQFILKASEDLYRHLNAGEINKNLYGPMQWKKLNMIISDPVQFFLEDINIGGNGYHTRLIETCEKVAVAQNKLNKLEQISNHSIIQLNRVKKKEFKVTVVVPAYNMEQYIDECIESILKQTLDDIEVICVDDGSTDRTFEKILEWTKRDENVRLICQANRGSGFARNQAMEMATGKYIMFMDADDWYPSDDVIQNLYMIAEKKNMYIVGGGMQAYKNGEICDSPDYYTFPEEGVFLFSDYQLDYGYTRYIYNLQFLKNNNIVFPNYARFQDPIFFVNALSTAKHFYAVKDIVYAYRKPVKKKKFNAIQCRDILLALKEEEVIAKRNGYEILQERIRERFLNEYFESYITYLCSNDLAVVDSFKSLFLILDDETKIKFINKIVYFISIKYVVPLKKVTQINGKNLNDFCEELEIANREWKQARFEVDSIRSSFSYKVGLLITLIPRKLRAMMTK